MKADESQYYTRSYVRALMPTWYGLSSAVICAQPASLIQP